MDWQAKWIWAQGEAAPRNFYWCVRKEFELPKKFGKLTITLSADTRYALWVNGRYVGQGPVRAFHGSWTYDYYDLTELAKPGLNVVAIIVHHLGLSTFQYDFQRGKGRGGLIAQVEHEGQIVAASDRTWLNIAHPAFDRHTTRMSCQLGFSEHYDARLYPGDWTMPTYDDYEWSNAVEIGDAGCAPWGELKPRPIPLLTMEPVSPKRILRARVVRPPKQTWAMDLKPTLLPGDLSANPRGLNGLLATVLSAEKPIQISLTAVHHGLRENDVKLNGVQIPVQNGTAVLNLTPGEYLLTINVSRWYHDWYFYPVFDYPDGQEVKLKNPVDEQAAYPWVTIGPRDDAADLRLELSDLKNGQVQVNQLALDHTATTNVFALTKLAQPVAEKPSLNRQENCLAPAPHSAILHPPQSGDLELLIDFGVETVGYVALELSAPEGTLFDFNGFEYLDPINLDRIQWTNGLDNTFRYAARGGWQRFRSLTRRGFRYATLTVRFPKGAQEPVLLREIKCYQNTYPYGERGEFHCSDPRLNACYEISRRTVRLCSEDTFVDCPTYEQTFWVGDSRNEALFSYTAFGDMTLARHCLLLAGESLRHSPLVESQVPSGWENILTAWSLLWAIACHEYYLFSGERAFLEEIYPAIDTQNRNLHEKFMNTQGLLEISAWNMLDWAPMDTPGEGVVTHQNMWLVLVWERTAQIADWLGKTQDAQTWRLWASDLREAVNQHLWNEEKQAYTDCLKQDGSQSTTFSQQTQVVAYLCGVVPQDKLALFDAPGGKGYLREVPEGFVRVGSPFMMAFVLEALAKANDRASILSLIRQWWGMMLDYDATTCWEVFPHNAPASPVQNYLQGYQGLQGGVAWGNLTRSHCHAWSAAPAFALPAYVLGVQPLEPGYRQFEVRPFLGDLQWAYGRVPTPCGEIEVALDKQGDKIDLLLGVPEGTTAVVDGKEYSAGKYRLQI